MGCIRPDPVKSAGSSQFFQIFQTSSTELSKPRKPESACLGTHLLNGKLLLVSVRGTRLDKDLRRPCSFTFRIESEF